MKNSLMHREIVPLDIKHLFELSVGYEYFRNIFVTQDHLMVKCKANQIKRFHFNPML